MGIVIGHGKPVGGGIGGIAIDVDNMVDDLVTGSWTLGRSFGNFLLAGTAKTRHGSKDFFLAMLIAKDPDQASLFMPG